MYLAVTEKEKANFFRLAFSVSTSTFCFLKKKLYSAKSIDLVADGKEYPDTRHYRGGVLPTKPPIVF